MSQRTAIIVLALLMLVPASAQDVIDSLEKRLKTVKGFEKAEIFNELARMHWENNPDKAIQYGGQGLELARKYQNHTTEARTLHYLCISYLLNDDYDHALEHGLAALDIIETVDDLVEEAGIISTLGWVYYDAQNADMALDYHQKSLDRYLQLKKPYNIAVEYNALGLAHSLKEEYEKALSFYLLSLETAEANDLEERIAAAHNNLGMTYTALKSYDLALNHLQQALQQKSATSSALSVAETWNQLGHTYTEMGQFEQAEESFKEGKEYIDHSNSKAAREKLVDYYEFTSNLYAAKGDYRQAFKDYHKYVEIRDEVYSGDQLNRIAELRLVYETEKRESKIASLEKQKKTNRLIGNCAIAALLLLLTVGYFTFNKLQSKYRQTLSEKEELQDKLEFKTQELSTLAMHIGQRNEIFRQLAKTLTIIEKNTNGSSSKEEIRKMLRWTKQSLDNKNELNDVHFNVEHSHQDFFYNLKKQYPELTENEKRLSAQIRVDLTNKDIASLNNISVKSVEMARYRLRKRLGLSTGDSLKEFLKKI